MRKAITKSCRHFTSMSLRCGLEPSKTANSGLWRLSAFVDAPFATLNWKDLLREGGNFTWVAGPIAKDPGLLPWHEREWLCISQALPSNRRPNVR